MAGFASERPDPDDLSVGFAPIEHLDPEPGRPHAAGARERIIGLILLAILVALGTWQWLGAQQGHAAYQAGVRAAAQQDWPAAAQAFQAAGSYDDAAAQARTAADNAARRDRAYAQAAAGARTGDWASVLEGVAQLRKVARGWRDSENLDALGDAHLYGAALSGTVAIRRQGSPPGLYRYADQTWNWLPGSDAHSGIIAGCADGGYIYDAPAVGSFDSRTAGALRLGPGTALLAGRVFRRSTPGGADAATLIISPPHYPVVICAPGGTWAYDLSAEAPGLLARPFPSFALLPTFQPIGATRLITPVLPGPNWYTVDIAPPGDRLLVLDAGPLAPTQWTTRLALADPTGHVTTTLPSEPGSLRWWTFAPDGSALLAGLDSPPPGLTVTETAVLFDLRGTQPPRVLGTATGPRLEDPGPAPFSATVVPNGALGGQFVLAWHDAQGQHVRIVDPTRPTAGPARDLNRLLDWVWPVPATGLGSGALLTGEPAGYPDDGSPDPLLYVDPAGLHELSPPLPGGFVATSAAVGGGRLALVGSARAWQAPARPFVVQSIPWPAAAAGPATTVYSGTIDPDGDGDRGVPWHLGPGFLVVASEGGTARVHTFDGSFDQPLSRDLAGFFDPLLDGRGYWRR